MNLATIDIGTNTTLLLVARSGPAVEVLEERAEITRLGRGIGRQGALDGEAIARTLAVLRDFAAVARRHGARIAAVGTEAYQAREKENAQLFLQSSANRLERSGYSARSQVLIGTAVESILDQARERNVDLILMGSRGRHGLSRLVLGSVSHAVLHSAPCPILVFN